MPRKKFVAPVVAAASDPAPVKRRGRKPGVKKITRIASPPKPASPKRRGRPPLKKALRGVKKSTGRSGNVTLLNRLMKEKAVKERWHAMAKVVRTELQRLKHSQKIEQRYHQALRLMSELKDRAVQAFSERWEQDYLARLDKLRTAGTTRRRRRRRRPI